MTQNQNCAINQFLQSKSNNNNNHYNHSIKKANTNEPYFDKNIFNRTSKKITPYLEPVNEDYFSQENNKLKTSYNENNIKKYYSINSHNHSEYVTNCSSDNFPKIIIPKNEKVKTEIRKKKSLESNQEYYIKTEINSIRKAHSGNYKTKFEEDSKNRYDKKKYRVNCKEVKMKNDIIQSSPSQPLLFKSIYNLEENKERNKNLNLENIDRRIYMGKTYNKKNSPNSQNSEGMDEKAFSYSISNIHSDSENIVKQIKNYKSTNIARNKFNIHNNVDKHIYAYNIIENNKNIKDNYKYHSITVRSKNKINKETMRIDFKKKYNINTNIINLNKFEKLNLNILNNRKNKSPNNLSNILKTNNIYNNRVLDTKENQNKDIFKIYDNHSLFESINLTKEKQKEISQNNNSNCRINTFLESVKIANNKTNLYLNNNYINIKNIQINENSSQKKAAIRISKVPENMSTLSKNKNKNNYEIKKNEIFDSKEKNNNYGHDSDALEQNKQNVDTSESNKNRIKNVDNNIFIENKLDNNKITYIYERKNKRQKSLTETPNDLNKLLGKESITTNINNNSNNINTNQINEKIKRNLGNVLKKIIKKNHQNQKDKKISIVDNNIEEKAQPSIIKTNDYEIEEKNDYKNKKTERKIKKSKSNYLFEKKIQYKENKKKMNIMEICKVNNITYNGNQNIKTEKEDKNKILNKSNNSNIIIIINNADKNKLKRNIKTPKNPKCNIEGIYKNWRLKYY